MKTYTIYLIETRSTGESQYRTNESFGFYLTKYGAEQAISKLPTNNPRCRIRTARVLP